MRPGAVPCRETVTPQLMQRWVPHVQTVSHACYLQAAQKGSFPVRTKQEKPNKCFGCSPSLELKMSRTGRRWFGYMSARSGLVLCVL